MDETDLLTADIDTQTSIKQELITIINNYDSKLRSMRYLYNEINTSSSWNDSSIKISFLNQLDKYIKKFETLKEEMVHQVSNLSNNTNQIGNIESRFSV